MSLRYYHFTFIVLNGGLPQIVDRKNRRQVKPSKSQKQNFASRPKRRQLFFFVQNVDNIFLQVVQIVDTINRYRLIERYISSSLTGRGVRGAEPPVDKCSCAMHLLKYYIKNKKNLFIIIIIIKLKNRLTYRLYRNKKKYDVGQTADTFFFHTCPKRRHVEIEKKSDRLIFFKSVDP